MLRSAVERQFGIVGEALSRLAKDDPDVAAAIPDHGTIIAFRNILNNGYATAYFALREQLGSLFAKPVDLVTPPGLATRYFRQRVEQEKTLLYAA